MRTKVEGKAENRQVALLRGVNVGGAKPVAMEELRAVVSALGFRDVRTLLNSGNVVFTSPKARTGDSAVTIRNALKSTLGVRVRVIVLSSEEMGDVIAQNTLLEVADNPSRLIVAVLADPSDGSKLVPLRERDWGKDRLAVGSRAAYLWCAEGVIKSKLNIAVNNLLGENVTSRNWATIVKLKGMLDGAG